VSSRSVYLKGAGAALPLDQVQSAVARYAGGAGPGALSATVIQATTGDTVVVNGRRSVHLPFASFLGIGDVTVTATSRASSVRFGSADRTN
jgi:hypothetical protein